MLERNVACGHGTVHWKHLTFFLALAASVALLSSCGGSGTPAAVPTITVSCATSQVTLLQQDQCTASVANLSSTLVNWTISGTGTGSIDSTGLYTAPSSVPSNNVVTVTAAAQAQTTLTGTTTITIVQPTAINSVVCLPAGATSQPSPLTVSSGNTLACSALSATGASVAVFWSVNGITNGNTTLGAITVQGVYTAPLIPPSGLTPPAGITITATSQALATQTLSVTATVVFGNRILNGQYAFSMRGRLTNGSEAFFARVGSFTAGGGTLTGIEDTNQAGASGAVKQQVTFTGSYSIGSDGRGTMQFCEGITSSCPAGSAAATAFFRIVVVSPQQAQIIDFSSPATTSASTTTAGEIISQDASVFGAGAQNLTGTYSFNFAGVSSGGAEMSEVGDFTANGFGTISANSPTTPGEVDVDATGAQVFAIPATYVITSNGRGTVTLNGLNFSFYMVSASQAKFIEIDAAPASILSGDAFKQQTTVACGWGLNALSGSTVFETAGGSSGIVIADLGSFTATNDGTTGTVSSASVDENSGGSVSSQIATLSGNYTVDPCGRGTLTIGSHSYVFYIISAAKAVLQEITSGVTAYGLLVQTQGGPFVDASLSGSFALRLSGTNAAGAAGQRQDILGQLTADGAGTLTGGTLDINNSGLTTGSAGVSIGSGTYLPTAAVPLRATMLLSPTRNLVLYLVSPAQFYVLDSDPSPSGTAIGSLYNQF